MRSLAPRARRLALSRLASGLLVIPLLGLASCTGDGGRTKSNSAPSTTHSRPLSVVLRGNLTLDGRPFDARFLGAVVRRAGLVTPCQYTLPPVEQGRYTITVLADTESRGCGAPGAEILLWTFVHEKIVYSGAAVGWPGSGQSARFDATFSRAKPNGDVPPTVQFNGELLARDGRKLPPGTRVEAYVGTTRCGIASTRRGGSFSGYVLAVVGPESIPGCERGATLTFRIDGRPAVETSRNDPSVQGHSLDLTQR